MTSFAWRVHRNPLFIKSLRSRLRRPQAVAWGIVTFVTCLFLFLTIFVEGVQSGRDPHTRAGEFLPVLLVLQGFILAFNGVGAVAYGIAEEREQGLVDYQRLTPLSRGDKILGYLFGLPVREYFLFALTLPFVLITAIWGGVGWWTLGKLYGVFLLLVVVYHLAGLASGMISTRPRRATWFGRLLIAFIYLLLPWTAAFGFTAFGHLTLYPTLSGVLRSEWGTNLEAPWARGFDDATLFMGLEVDPTLFTIALQFFVGATLVATLMRKWQHDAKPALSKRQAVVVFAGVMLLVVGSLAPLLIDPRKLFAVAVALERGGTREALMLVYYLFWAVCGALALLLVATVVPAPDRLTEGLRRARKHGRARLSPWADRAPGLWFAVALGALSAGAFAILVAFTSKSATWFGGFEPGPGLVLPPFILACALVTFQGIRQVYGLRGLFFSVFLIVVFPGMASIVMGLFAGPDAAVYVGMPSPPMGIGIASAFAFDLSELSRPDFVVGAVAVNVAMASWSVGKQRTAYRTTQRSVSASMLPPETITPTR